MPYAIKKKGSKHLVVNADSGKVMGEHDSKEEAMSQMRVLYMKDPDARKKAKK